jgi:2-keto-3-deoxy-L-rhamnonate aldolase RhmA
MHNFVKEKLAKGESVVGIWSIIPSAMVCEIVASSGLDFMILDMEHGSFDLGTLTEAIRSIVDYKCSPLVRVPFIEQTLIQRVLDAGAHGIIAPQVKSADDARKLVECCHFSPDGIRGFNPYTRAGNFIADNKSLYLDDDFPLLTIIVENLDAYSNLSDILRVEGVDVFYLGIYDMSCAFNVRGELSHPKVERFVEDASRQIVDAGKTVGKMIDKVAHEGSGTPPQFLVLQPDTFQLKKAIQSRL